MIGNLVGPKYMAIAKAWVPTMAAWGTAAGVTLVYFTDWKVVLKYVPYINGKFKNEE